MSKNRIVDDELGREVAERIIDALRDLGRRMKRGEPIPITEIKVTGDTIEITEGSVIFGNRG